MDYATVCKEVLMFGRFVILPAALTAFGCSSRAPTEAASPADPAIEKVEASVMAKLRDPGSAEFSNVRVINGGMVCGEVNSKNGYGGYVGKRRFFGSSGPDGVVYIDDGLSQSPSADLCRMHDQAEAKVSADEEGQIGKSR